MKLEYEAKVAIAEVAKLSLRQIANINTIYNDAATIRLVESSDNLQSGCLAGTTWTNNAHNLTFINM